MKYPIVKPFLPELEHYQLQVAGIFQRNRLTNQGPCVEVLTEKLKSYLGVAHLLLVANGTQALHVAYQTLGITKAITTPFTFAATPGSLQFQNIQCRFSDISPATFNLAPELFDERDLQWADALVPVHVFGNPCDVEQMQALATKHQLKVIYDAAHCFGSEYNGESLLKFGDCATLSLHATKLFHTIEGGAIIFKHEADLKKAQQIINFGQSPTQIPLHVGTNAKMSEMHAAMGLCVFEHIEDIITHRKSLQKKYMQRLTSHVKLQRWQNSSDQNGAYMPILLNDESELLFLSKQLEAQGIQTRRYFYPCLSDLDVYSKPKLLPNAHQIAKRVLCLPMYYDLTFDDISVICDKVIDILDAYR